MDRKEIVALLKEHGATVDDKATNEQLLAQLKGILNKKTETPAPAPASASDEIAKELKALREAREAVNADREAARKNRIEGEIDKLVTECRIPANEKAEWVSAVLANESILSNLKKLPVNKPGDEAVLVTVVSDSVQDIDKAIADLRKPISAFGKGNLSVEPKTVGDNANQISNLIKQYKDKLVGVWNANTISSDLKRAVLLQDVVRAFAKVLFPLRAFATVYSNVPLQGTDEVAVPYYALDASATTDFVVANGYDTFGGTATSSKKVTVDKRKYQGMSFTSSELRRQPYFNQARLAGLKGETLSKDVWLDILGLILNANYSSSTTIAAASFDSDSIAGLRTTANQAQWPQAGRSLFVDSAYDGNLLKDASIKSSAAFGGSEAIRQGQVPQIFGFDYYQNPNIPSNGENLTGFIAFMSAILMASSPIAPAEEVRQQLSRYDLATDEETGLTIEYRAWGDPDKDTAKNVIEFNYGKITGEAAALSRIKSA